MADKRKLDDSTAENGESMSLHDIIAETEELENTANAVLGGSDQHMCTYNRGYIYRQALYACNTCREEKGAEVAGVCLACSFECHDGHDLFELYTKRNFRCDCGNKKFNDAKCKFNDSKDDYNTKNEYNHNFEGRYCICSRPYPDPDDSIDDEMIQCIVCEDWYHSRHLVLKCDIPEDYEEMICHKCSVEYEFLQYYNALVSKIDINESNVSIDVEDVKTNLENKNKVEQNLRISNSSVEKLNSDTMEKNKLYNNSAVKSENTNGETSISKDINSVTVDTKPKSSNDGTVLSDDTVAPMVKIMSVKDSTKSVVLQKTPIFSEGDCKLEILKKFYGSDVESTAMFCLTGWRAELCKCKNCETMMEKLNLEFLYKTDDMISEYEKNGSGSEIKSYNKGMEALGEMDRVQQVEVIHGYNDMKSGLVDYLKSLGQGKVVTENDIKTFFEQLKTKKKPRVDMGYFCK